MSFRGTDEEDVTNGLLEVGSREKRVVGFLRGYGEHETGLDRDVGLSKAVDALRQEYYEVRDVSLAEGIPDDVTVLVAAGLMLPIPKPELDRLAAWLEKGGRLLALLEADDRTGLGPVLERWGLRGTGETNLRPAGQHEPTARVPAGHELHDPPGRPRLREELPDRVPVRAGRDPLRARQSRVFHDDVAKTGEFSFSESASGTRRQGPFATVVASWKRIEGRKIGAETRVILVGDSDFATNLRLPVAANRNFFLTAWVALPRAEPRVRPEARPQGAGHRAAAGDRTLALLLVLAAPFVVVLVGILVGLRRRSL